jgi:hypothetical protein
MLTKNLTEDIQLSTMFDHCEADNHRRMYILDYCRSKHNKIAERIIDTIVEVEIESDHSDGILI